MKSTKPKFKKLTITKAQKRSYHSYNEKVKHYRSLIIEESTSLEVQLEWIISSYFSHSVEEYALFNYVFFSDEVKIGFYDKIIMFFISFDN